VPQWGVEWLVTDHGDRTIPGLTFLRGQSPAVRRQLLAILDAVRTTGPDQWRDTTLPAAFYEALERLAATTDVDPPPFATTDDVLRLVLDEK
jgi:hypothetical protein